MSPSLAALPLIDTPDVDARLGEAPAEVRAFARSLAERGYARVDLGPEGPALCEAAARELEPYFADGTVDRVSDAWRKAPAVRALAGNARVLAMLEAAYGRPAFPFQTLNFREGSQQPAHADSFHFHSDPPGFMCGVWIALEDVEPDAGPLFYYPGSHRLPKPTMAELSAPGSSDHQAVERRYGEQVAALVSREGLSAERALLKKGEAFVWTAGLLHGGKPIARPGATRRSLVVHYFFEGCFYYTPRTSDEAAGRYTARLATDVRTGRWVWSRRNGRRAWPPLKFLADAVRRRLLPAPVVHRRP